MTIAQEFAVNEATISAERGFKPVDLSAMIMEVSFFESLDKPYITGQLVLLDDHAILDEIEIRGTENIKLDLKGGDLEGARESLFFEGRIVSIVKQYKQSDKQEVYALNFISKHGYDDELIKLSKSYTGKLEDIVKTVMKNELDVTVLDYLRYFDPDQESVQDEVRVITPYISPIETTKWLLDRATGKNGSPFYVWQSIWDEDNIARIGDLKQMIEEGIERASDDKEYTRPPFLFSTDVVAHQSNKELNEGKGNTTDQSQIIRSMHTTKLEDTLKMAREGSVGSMLQTLDTFTTQKVERHFEVPEIIKEFKNKEFEFILDEDAIATKDEVKLKDTNARYRNLVSSYGTYNTINSYHDAFDQVEAMNKVRSLAIKSALYRNMVEVNFHGVEFWQKELSVGDVLQLRYSSSTTDDQDTGKLSVQRSGFFLIYDLRHLFQTGYHTVSCSLCKIRNLDSIPVFKGKKINT